MAELYMGIDCSIQSCKMVIFDCSEKNEERRKHPISENYNSYRLLIRMYRSIRVRIRGHQSVDDPFELRNELVKLYR